MTKGLDLINELILITNRVSLDASVRSFPSTRLEFHLLLRNCPEFY